MDSAPHLRIEDRPEFERVLDEALRTAGRRPDGAGGPGDPQLSTGQLRTMALGASAAIAACAAAEYEHFVRLREELRRPERAPSCQGPAPGGGAAVAAGPSGAGLGALLAVLAPLLAGTAAVVFLAVGHALRLVAPEPSVAAPMRDTGRVFAALAAASLLAAAGGLLIAALRNGSTSIRAGGAGGRDALAEEVDLARTAWRAALLERGVLPFLQEVLRHRGVFRDTGGGTGGGAGGSPAAPGAAGQEPAADQRRNGAGASRARPPAPAPGTAAAASARLTRRR